MGDNKNSREGVENESGDSPIYFDEEKQMTINRETGDFLKNSGSRDDQGVFVRTAFINGIKYEFVGIWSVNMEKNVNVFKNKRLEHAGINEPYFNNDKEKSTLQSIVSQHLRISTDYGKKEVLGCRYTEFYIDRSEYDKVN